MRNRKIQKEREGGEREMEEIYIYVYVYIHIHREGKIKIEEIPRFEKRIPFCETVKAT